MERSRAIPPLLTALLRSSASLLDVLPIPTFVCDAEGRILQYNQLAL